MQLEGKIFKNDSVGGGGWGRVGARYQLFCKNIKPSGYWYCKNKNI